MCSRLSCLACSLLMLAWAGAVSADTITFDDGDPANSNWTSPLNWNTDTVPEQGDNVIIPAGLTAVVTTDVGQYTGGGESVVVNGTLHVTTGRIGIKYIGLSGGTIEVDYSQGAELWESGHGNQQIKTVTDEPIIKLLMGAGDPPNATIKHGRLESLDLIALVVDLSAMSVPATPTSYALFDTGANEKTRGGIVDNLAFKTVEFLNDDTVKASIRYEYNYSGTEDWDRVWLDVEPAVSPLASDPFPRNREPDASPDLILT